MRKKNAARGKKTRVRKEIHGSAPEPPPHGPGDDPGSDQAMPKDQPEPEAVPMTEPGHQSLPQVDYGSGGMADPSLGETVIPEEPVEEFLAFKVSGEEYAIDIMAIREIIRPVPVTYVPRAPGYINGIVSIRGTIVPIFDLTRRLGLKPLAGGKSGRIVAVSFGSEMAGFMVDSVTEVVRLRGSEIDPPPVTLPEGRAEYIRGVGRYKGRMVVIMDVGKTLSAKGSMSLAVEHRK